MPYKEFNEYAEVVLVTGDRDWQDVSRISDLLAKFTNLKLVIHGNARGADSIAENICKARKIPYMGVPANWEVKGKAAGPIRNSEMLWWLEFLYSDRYGGESGLSCQVLAFHSDIKNSKGTKDMCEKASKAGFSVYLVER